MTILKITVLPILLSTAWISVSEFVRNEFIVKSYWVNHYNSLGLIFPSEPVNGMIWGIWALFFSIAIYIISKKFGLVQTALLSWFVGFVLMWVVIGNMGVLPFSLLIYAIPLSLIEAFVASYIMYRFTKDFTTNSNQ